MSKDINLENSISASVDEFEKFQAISMYEEDEYITLSDIVSSPQRNPDITEILDDLPGDDDHAEIVQNSKPKTEIPALSGVSQLFQSTSRKSSSEITQSTYKIPKKRGRKKKIAPNEAFHQNIQKFSNTDSGLNYDMIIGEETEVESTVNNVSRKNNRTAQNTDSGLNYDMIIGEEIESQQQIKTARNPDSDLNYDMIMGEEIDLQSTTYNDNRTAQISSSDSNYNIVISNEKNVPMLTQEKKRRGRKPKLKTDLSSNVCLTKKRDLDLVPTVEKQQGTVKKRGRKKKSLEAITSADDLDLKKNQANDNKKLTKKKRKNVKKMGDPKKEENKTENVNDTKDNLDIDDSEDVPLIVISNRKPVSLKTVDTNKGTELDSHISVIPSQTDSNPSGILPNTSIVSLQVNSSPLLEKVPKKRGRPKKIKVQTPEIIINNDKPEKDEISLSKLKDTSDNFKDHLTDVSNDTKAELLSNQDNMQNISPNKRNSKRPVMDDYEYNIDSIIRTEDCETASEVSSRNREEIPLIESSRPVRRNTKKILLYDEGSDEDPFANVESSDDEPQKRKKGGRYNSDNEYFPGKKRVRSDTESDSEIGSDFTETKSHKRGNSKKADSVLQKSPKKRNKKSKNPDVDNPSQLQDDVDFELNLETSVIKLNEDKTSNQHVQEFENFLAKMTEIKVKKAKSLGNEKVPFEIPTIDPTKEKKTIEVGSQTNLVKATTIGVQTNTLYEVPMKNQVPLSEEQTVKAVDFLSNTVKTTSELGLLMTQKSDDFIHKKINAKYVTDTFKMDYCVKKSFLLLKLAKHNLVQMEEDLAKQYEEFLKANDLIQHREEQKVIASTSKVQSSDSDCEIVEETIEKKTKEKPAFNPKTVFLNKELSIKIAKKSPTLPKPKEKLNVKGRHTVWINDSIMVKKIKPTQSFLAQDSRNKKPPDTYVTLEMVSDFFKMYEYQKAISICAPHIGTNWFQSEKLYICNYFIEKSSDFTEAAHMSQREDILSEDSFAESEQNNVNDTKISSEPTITCPKTLLSMCAQVINQYLYFKETLKKNACSYQMNIDTVDSNNFQKNINYKERVYSLKTLCYKTIKKLIHVPNFSENETKLVKSNISKPTSSQISEMDVSSENSFREVNSLLTISLTKLQNNSRQYNCTNGYPKEVIYHNASRLKYIALERVKNIIWINKFNHQEENEQNNHNGVKSLSEICTYLISNIFSIANDNDIKHLEKNEKNNAVKSLSEICTNFMSMIFTEANGNNLESNICSNAFSYLDKNKKRNHNAVQSLSEICTNFVSTICTEANGDNLKSIICKNTCSYLDKNEKSNNNNAVKKLSELCTNFISMVFKEANENVLNKELALQISKFNAKMSLKSICFNKVISLMKTHIESPITDDMTLNFTINNVNTISEDIFLERSKNNFDNINGNELYTDDEHNFSDDLELPYEGTECDENNWVSQVQMQELRTCVDPMNLINSEKSQKIFPVNCLVNIKVEPLEEISENAIDSSTIKHEPEDETETVITPIDVITKQEYLIPTSTEFLRKERNNSYNDDAFETFVSSNKMIQSMANFENDDVFSQSALRVRMQHEPDFNQDIDTLTDSMNLLIPQNIELAKDRLMESSSDEGTNKKTGKVKVARRRGRPKKVKGVVEPAKGKAPTKNDLTMLTRKMKGRIRLEERKKVSSESESEDIILKQVKEKDIPKTNNVKHGKNKIVESKKEIQCNDVDSTENINENMPNICKRDLRKKKNKSSAESNKIIHNESSRLECKQSTSSNDGLGVSSLVTADEPVELLQCTPSIPSLDNYFIENESNIEHTSDTAERNEAITYIERHGWKCYPITNKDTKIYQYASVFLDKLPESFVETYFKYQNVSERSQNDTEIDKLTNLHTLHRTQSKEKGSSKIKECRNNNKYNSADIDLDNNLEAEHYNELSPSEEEDNKIDEDDLPLIAPQHNSDNSLAKNILMDVDESDREDKESKIKEGQDNLNTQSIHSLKPKEHLQNKEMLKEDFMLTADKMMNKELSLLHTPVELHDGIKDVKDIDSKPSRSSHKNSTRSNGVKEKLKDDDDSSSEEEKQWFTTKEKLLKRLQKKQDTPSVDDAKRTKIVNEFIEKRSDSMDIRRSSRPRARRSKKKILERRKQMKILSRELFGDESTHTGKKSQSQTYSKGRRNIRKVIDKKLLARATVLANMEEFERKRRLTQVQGKLREVLGCEEGVNVVVINDELCLEYDFEQMCPVVTVHPFFTKVMKAHQYEGVKFMWDACFESVSQVSRGNKGGGCILAHCMGLGKTLQVLALLHTVLTHPHLGMRRVLVCCPLSTVLNWVDEINKWIGPVTDKIKRNIKKKLQVFELSKLKKTYERAYQLEDWFKGGGIFIIGYELFRSLTTLDPVIDCVRPTIINKIRKALLDPGPDIIICDEGHLLKNDCSVLAVAMSRVVTKRRIILTGTPMQNNLREYYCMVNFVKPNLLGTYAEYSNRFENPIMNGQHRDSREEDTKLMKARSHILHKVLEGCLQRQEASVLYPYLPKKHEYTVFITLTKCQWDLYKHYLVNYAKASKQNVLKDFHVLQKIWSHPQVLHNFFLKSREDDKQTKIKVEKLEDDLAHEDLGASEDIKPNAMETWWLQYVAETGSLDSLHSSNKFLFIFRLLDECTALGDKVLIFSTSLYTMDALEYFLRRINNWSLGKDYYRLDGSVPAEVRQKWCREFNAPNNTTTKLFLISTRAGCLGLNMTAANRVIILDTSWNPAHDIQSIFRVYRFGQKKDCYIYRLVAMGTMEQKIYERSVTKQAVACRVVDEQQIDRHYNMSELSELYRFDDDDFGVSAGLAPGVHDAALLRVAHGLAVEGGESKDVVLHAVHEHDSLLRGSGETNLPEHERAAAWMQFQQEHHTHNNIQNIAIKPKKDKKENRMKTDSQKNKQEPTNEQEKRYVSRSKKGKKAVNTNNSIEQPCTSGQVDPQTNVNMEQDMIRKIMSILIKHGLHLSNGPEEISQLVANVRNRVANFKNNELNTGDPLVESIARVLLTGNATSPTDLPDPTNLIVPEQTILGTSSLDQNADIDDKIVDEYSDMTLGRKRRKQRRDSDEEYVPENMRRKKVNDKSSKRKSNESVSPVDNFVDSEIDQSTLDECLRSSHMQDTPEMSCEPQASTSKQMDVTDSTELIKAVTVSPKRKKEIKGNKKCKSKQEPVQEPVTVQENRNTVDNYNNNEDSIVLSDDDEPLLVTARNLGNTFIKSTSVENNVQNDIVTSPPAPPVPLHKSLLTNQNFIKIVAHTYLTGNPMLDEDAAVLAAQYSTLKALKEMEATKKDIVSGPLYDIAKEVLGMPILEKLQNVHSNKKDTVKIKKEGEDVEKSISSTSFATENLQNTFHVPDVHISEDSSNTMKTAKVQNKVPKKKSKPKNKKQLPPSTQSMIANDLPQTIQGQMVSIASSPSSTPNVVPIGMFKGSASVPTNGPPDTEECILPDDDDDIIITNDYPPISAIPPINSDRRHSQQLSLTSVCSDTKSSHNQFVRSVDKAESILPNDGPPRPVRIEPKPFTISIPSNNICVNPQQLPSNITSSQPTFIILPQNLLPVVSHNLVPVTKNNLLPVANNNPNDTICLDSDDEVTLVPDKPKPIHKAVKSTTKLPYSLPQTSTSKQPKLKKILPKPEVPIPKSITKISHVPGEIISDLSDPDAISKVREASNNTSDIIRITESGKIEVLRRFVSTEVAPYAVSDKIDVTSATEEFITGDLNQYTPRIQQKHDNKIHANVKSQEVVQKVEKSSKGTSEKKIQNLSKNSTEKKIGKSYSGDIISEKSDPLSVLQNVVQIPADNYDPTTTGSRVKREMHSVPMNIIVKSTITKPTTKQPETVVNKPKNVNNIAKLSNIPGSINLGNPQPGSSTSKERVTPDQTEKRHNKSHISKKGDKISGSSKDIILSKAGMLIKVQNNGNHKRDSTIDLTDVTNKPSTSSSLKRPASWQDPSSKKKRQDTKQAMSLKDFNLDDIDDIIELE